MKNNRRNRGFTLVEIMVALSIFSIVALAVVNAFITADRINKKAQAMKTVIDNLHFALSGMAFNLKQGGSYHCFDGDLSDVEALRVLTGCPGGNTAIAVTTPKGGARKPALVAYRFNEVNGQGRIEYWKEGETNNGFIPLTVNSLDVAKMRFYVQNTGAQKMPFVFITFEGEARAAQMTTKLRLQTAISERL